MRGRFVIRAGGLAAADISNVRADPLTLGFIEGMQLQSLMQGTGLALLELSLVAKAAVCVGNTVWATVEVTAARATSSGDRGVITFAVEVFDQDDRQVLTYTVKRLVKRRRDA